MVVLPALIYVAVVGGGERRGGWGIPVATDIAFAVGILALLGGRASGRCEAVPAGVAIVDDMIAIAVIAIFYTEPVSAWAGWSARRA